MTREELLKIAKPILFNTEMVQAILEGRKTVTRRVLAEKEVLDKKWGLDEEPYKHNGKWYFEKQTAVDDSRRHELKSRYQVGDILYVRETWRKQPVGEDGHIEIEYKADFNEGELACYGRRGGWTPRNWKPSIHMPKELARIFLKVTDVRVERLLDMSIEDMIREGVKVSDITTNRGIIGYRVTNRFQELWDSTIKKKELDMYGMEANPWVWVIEFERVEED